MGENGAFEQKYLQLQKSKNGFEVENFPGKFIKNGVLKQIFDLKGKDFLVRKKRRQLFGFSEQLTFSFLKRRYIIKG